VPAFGVLGLELFQFSRLLIRFLPQRSLESDLTMKTPETVRRQFVSFISYKLMPEWRRLPRPQRQEHRQEFASVLRRWCVPDTMKVLTYSLVGMRADADFLLWQICYSLDCLQEMSAELLRTSLGGYLQARHSFLSMTRSSQYLIGSEPTAHSSMRGGITPGHCKYLSIYPLVRSNTWYALPFEQRQRMVNDLVKMTSDFSRIHLNFTYSFGLDDQEFVIILESDHPEDFLERMMQVRTIDVGSYVLRDTPSLTGVQTSPEEMLERIG
jgi:chlorite dismutase